MTVRNFKGWNFELRMDRILSFIWPNAVIDKVDFWQKKSQSSMQNADFNQ